MTDLKPHDRESYLAARTKLERPGIPLVVAVEDYVQCRDMLNGIPLRQAVEDFIRRTHRVKLGVKVPQVVAELLEAKIKDGMSGRYIGQLRSSLGLFSRAFSGIRMAELNRLDWSAVDLERGHIELRAGQAKTASRRIIPISDNLRTWIEPLPRVGKVVPMETLHREVTALARAMGVEWPRNVLRHSFISYRIAKVKSADQVALEAGNSAAIIFKHYRELATEEQAEVWFGILPKPGQWENTVDYDTRTRTVNLAESNGSQPRSIRAPRRRKSA